MFFLIQYKIFSYKIAQYSYHGDHEPHSRRGQRSGGVFVNRIRKFTHVLTTRV